MCAPLSGGSEQMKGWAWRGQRGSGRGLKGQSLPCFPQLLKWNVFDPVLLSPMVLWQRHLVSFWASGHPLLPPGHFFFCIHIWPNMSFILVIFLSLHSNGSCDRFSYPSFIRYVFGKCFLSPSACDSSSVPPDGVFHRAEAFSFNEVWLSVMFHRKYLEWGHLQRHRQAQGRHDPLSCHHLLCGPALVRAVVHFKCVWWV